MAGERDVAFRERFPESVFTDRPLPGGQTAPPRMYYVCTTLGAQEWLNRHHVLVSAGVAWRNPGGDSFDIYVPEEPATLLIDSGGFQAAAYFGDEYPYTPRELFEWAEDVGADYVAGMDWLCNPAEDLASKKQSLDADDIAPIPDRIEWSIEQQIKQYRVYKNGDWSFELMPSVQGHEPEDYQYCARRLKEAGVARPYMGLGSIKGEKKEKVREILSACHEELPHTAFHLFGATRFIWKDPSFWGDFISGDTHAWALKTPEGNWTSDRADKRDAFYYYKAKTEYTIEDIYDDLTLPENPEEYSPFELLVKYGDGAKRCACGTAIPTYGADFEPGCRNCERTQLNRQLKHIDDLDRAVHPVETHLQDEPVASEGAEMGDSNRPATRPTSADSD